MPLWADLAVVPARAGLGGTADGQLVESADDLAQTFGRPRLPRWRAVDADKSGASQAELTPAVQSRQADGASTPGRAGSRAPAARSGRTTTRIAARQPPHLWQTGHSSLLTCSLRHRPPAAGLYSRRACDNVLAALADTRVVVLNGARQTGKSTLARLVAALPADRRLENQGQDHLRLLEPKEITPSGPALFEQRGVASRTTDDSPCTCR